MMRPLSARAAIDGKDTAPMKSARPDARTMRSTRPSTRATQPAGSRNDNAASRGAASISVRILIDFLEQLLDPSKPTSQIEDGAEYRCGNELPEQRARARIGVGVSG